MHLKRHGYKIQTAVRALSGIRSSGFKNAAATEPAKSKSNTIITGIANAALSNGFIFFQFTLIKTDTSAVQGIICLNIIILFFRLNKITDYAQLVN